MSPRAKPLRRPDWLKVSLDTGEDYRELKRLIGDQALNTVCEEARCPNLHECWNARSATFMILGDTCTRHCGFCSVGKGRPLPPDPDEPRRVAEAVRAMACRHAVLTSVDRDDLPDLAVAAAATISATSIVQRTAARSAVSPTSAPATGPPPCERCGRRVRGSRWKPSFPTSRAAATRSPRSWPSGPRC